MIILNSKSLPITIPNLGVAPAVIDAARSVLGSALYALIMGAFFLYLTGLFSLYVALVLVVGIAKGEGGLAGLGFGLGGAALLAASFYLIRARIKDLMPGVRAGVWASALVAASVLPGVGTIAYWWLVTTSSAEPDEAFWRKGRRALTGIALVLLALLTIVPLSRGLFDAYLIQNDLAKVLRDPTRYRHLNLYGQKIVRLPDEIGGLTNLESLNANDNGLTTLPPTFANLIHLERLYLRTNQLSAWPEALAGLPNLKELDLDKNQFAGVPKQAFSLPKLRRFCIDRELLERYIVPAGWRVAGACAYRSGDVDQP